MCMMCIAVTNVGLQENGSSNPMCTQAFNADVLVGEPPHLCIQVLASKLDKAFVGFTPMGPRDPLSSSIYPKSGRKAFLPNPLAYVPQADAEIITQHMVSRL